MIYVLDPEGPDAQLLDQLLQRHFPGIDLPWVLAYGDVRQGAAFVSTLRKVLNRAAAQLAEHAASPWAQALGAGFAALSTPQLGSALVRVFLCSGVLAELTWVLRSCPTAPLAAPSSTTPSTTSAPPSTTSAPPSTTSATPSPAPQPTFPRAASPEPAAPAGAAPAHEPGTRPRAPGVTREAQPAAQATAAQASDRAPAPPGARGPGLDLCAVPAGRQRLTLLLIYAGVSLAPPMAAYLLQAAEAWAKLAGSGSGSGSRSGRPQKRGPQAPRAALQPLHQRSLRSDQDLIVLWPPVLSWLSVMAMECVDAAQEEVGPEAAAGAAGTGAGGASSSRGSGSGSGSAVGACGGDVGGGGGEGAGGGGREGAGRGERAGGGGGGVRPGLRVVTDACRQMALQGMGAVGLVGAALRQTVPLAPKEPPGCEEVMPALATALCCLAAAFPEEVRQAVEETAHLAGAAGGPPTSGDGGGVRSGAAAAAAAKPGGGGGVGRSGDAGSSAGGSGAGAAAVSGEVWPRQLVRRLGAYLRGRQQQQPDGTARYTVLLAAFRVLETLLKLWTTGRGQSEGGEGQEQLQLQRAHVEGVAALRGAVRAMDWVARASLKLGGVHVGPGELRVGLLRTCAFPACVSLEGDSEAEAEGQLVACARGCGAAWYCSKACMEGHWAAGHGRSCGAVGLG